jgi:surface protein
LDPIEGLDLALFLVEGTEGNTIFVCDGSIVGICIFEYVGPDDGSLLPTPNPAAAPVEGGRWSGVFGDPHLSTFDRLRFDCQAAGEFTMVTSLENPEFRIQERFTSADSTTCAQASVSTGIAVNEQGLPTIQLSLPRGDGMGGACPVDLFANGILQPLGSESGIEDIIIAISGARVSIRYPLTGMQVQATIHFSPSFGCFFRTQVFLPFSYRPGETIVGLLGKPNGIRGDDWVSPDGSSSTPPADDAESIFSPAYNYCVSNWCIREEADSIFTYKDDESFSSISGCDEDYASDIEQAVTNPSDELVEVCGTNPFCLVDGFCGNLNDAVLALADEEAIVSAQEEGDPMNETSAPTQSPILTSPPTFETTPLAATAVPSSAQSSGPTATPPASPGKCFEDRSELDTALGNLSLEREQVEATYGPIRSWCVSRITDFSRLFQGMQFFNEPLDAWDVSSVTDMSRLFFRAASFNQDLSSWDVSSVTDMSGLFEGAASFNQDLSSWDVSSVTGMGFLFAGAASFNQDLCSWGPLLRNRGIGFSIFAGSGCPDTRDPDTTANPPSPLCVPCV